MSEPAASLPPRPWWVRAILWGVPTRAHAWAYVWLCLLIALASSWYGLTEPRAFFGAFLLLGALGYWVAIRWMDRYGKWGK